MDWRRVANNEKSKSAISQSILCGQKMISQHQQQQHHWQRHLPRLCPLQKQQIENRTQINWIESLSSMVTIDYKHTQTHRLCIIQHNWHDVICGKAATFFLLFSSASLPSIVFLIMSIQYLVLVVFISILISRFVYFLPVFVVVVVVFGRFLPFRSWSKFSMMLSFLDTFIQLCWLYFIFTR